jgi:TolB-like protein
MASLLDELKRRNVFRVAVAYLMLAWVVLQITDLVAPALLLPDWTLSFVTFLGILGFPFALFFAWAFELTPDGIKRSKDITADESITGQTAGTLKTVIIALLGIAVCALLADRYLVTTSHQPLNADPITDDTAEVEPGNQKPRSIAVLPFVNMSDDPGQEFFSDGISEELLNALAKVRELRVAARTSSFAFKDKNQDITSIGDQLKVETVLEGSVRKSGNRVRITAQLISVADGYHIWSETYDRHLNDVFAVQDEISTAIVEALKIHLSADEAVGKTRQINLEAYDWFLKGRQNTRHRDQEALELAARQLDKALQIDPEYADAWGARGLVYYFLGAEVYGDVPTEEAYARGMSAIEQSLSLDPTNGLAFAARSLIENRSGALQASLDSIDKALEAYPSEGEFHLWRSWTLYDMGRFAEQEAALLRAFEIDRLHPAITRAWLGFLIDAERYDEARDSVLPGTPNYYQVEMDIATNEGQAARAWKLNEEFGERFPKLSSQVEHAKGWYLLYGFKEPGRAMDYVRGDFRKMAQALAHPRALIDSMGAIEPGSLEGEPRHAYMVALSRLNMYVDILAFLAPYDFESMEFKGWGSHSMFAQAVLKAYALYVEGDRKAAVSLAEHLLAVYDAGTIGQEEPYANYRTIELLALLGRNEEAINNLRKGVQILGGLSWINFERQPAWKLLEGEAEYNALKESTLDLVNAERAKLGWEPVGW